MQSGTPVNAMCLSFTRSISFTLSTFKKSTTLLICLILVDSNLLISWSKSDDLHSFSMNLLTKSSFGGYFLYTSFFVETRLPAPPSGARGFCIAAKGFDYKGLGVASGFC